MELRFRESLPEFFCDSNHRKDMLLELQRFFGSLILQLSDDEPN